MKISGNNQYDVIEKEYKSTKVYQNIGIDGCCLDKFVFNVIAKGYVTYEENGVTYNDYVGREEGRPVYVGKRMFIGGAGVLLNGVQNPTWAAEIFRTLPLAGDNPDDPDTFCMAIFDAYMSPQARHADYVFPMVNT